MPERMRVNIGGDPGRDDYGLPPVDIEIPDDARELDRDVQAYFRELRAQRRRMLARRLSAPLTRDGMVLPLLAGCLALTLLAGTLLTVLTTGQESFTPTRSPAASTANARPRPVTGHAPAYLPDETVEVNGQQATLSALAGTVLVLALVPPACRCRAELRHVAGLAQHARASTYLVGGASQQVQVLNLAKDAGLGASHAVTDTYGQLPPAYHPAELTAVLVRVNGTIAGFVPDPAHNPEFAATLQSLSPVASIAPATTKALPRAGSAGPSAATLAAVSG
jgi:hypothetical protein